MSDQQAYGHFGKFQLGDHLDKGYVILKKAPLKYYDDDCQPEDKTKVDVLFLFFGGNWIYIGSFLPAPEEEGLTEGMATEIETYLKNN